MFKKRGAEHQLDAELSDLRKRQRALGAEATSATEESEQASCALQAFLESGDLADVKSRARLDAAALAADGRAAPLKRALEALSTKIASVEQRLDDTREQARQEALYERALAAAGEAQSRLERIYPKLAAELVQLIGQSADAWNAIHEANNNLPEGREPIGIPEVLMRGKGPAPEEIVAVDDVEMWVYESTGQLISDQDAVVSASQGSGIWRSGGSSSLCRRQRFRRVSFHAATGPSFERRLDELVVLPALHSSAPPYWTPTRSDQLEDVPELVRSSLAKDRNVKRHAVMRVPEVRYEPAL